MIRSEAIDQQVPTLITVNHTRDHLQQNPVLKPAFQPLRMISAKTVESSDQVISRPLAAKSYFARNSEIDAYRIRVIDDPKKTTSSKKIYLDPDCPRKSVQIFHQLDNKPRKETCNNILKPYEQQHIGQDLAEEHEFSVELELAIADLEQKNKDKGNTGTFRIKSPTKRNEGHYQSPGSKRISTSTASYMSKCNLVRNASLRSFKLRSKDIKEGDDLLQRAYKVKPHSTQGTDVLATLNLNSEPQIGLSKPSSKASRWTTIRNFCFNKSVASSPDKCIRTSGFISRPGPLAVKSSYSIVMGSPKENKRGEVQRRILELSRDLSQDNCGKKDTYPHITPPIIVLRPLSP